jgi:hypothetical protein
MTFLPQLEHELLAAHSRRQARPRRAARLRAAAGVGAAAAVAAAVIVLLVVGIGPHHHTTIGGGPTSPPPHGTGPLLPTNPTKRQLREEQYLNEAFTTLSSRDHACSLTNLSTNRKPTISHGSPSQALLSLLGVLRRPATTTDRLPARITYHPYKRDPTGSIPPLKGVYVRYIRRARWRYGAGYYIVPAANANDGIRPMPARCYPALRASMAHELNKIPPDLRAGTRKLEPRFINQIRARSLPAEGVCLVTLNRSGNGGSCIDGYTLADIKLGHTVSSGGPTGVDVVYGLVPDGVATVTLRYRTGSITAPAINNVFIARDRHQHLPNYGIPKELIWRAANHTVIKTITNPPPNAP